MAWLSEDPIAIRMGPIVRGSKMVGNSPPYEIINKGRIAWLQGEGF